MESARSSPLRAIKVHRALLLAFTLLSLVASLSLTSSTARAATVYCGTQNQQNTVAGITWKNYIDVYTDPGCTGSRKVAYDYYANTWASGQLYAVDQIYLDYFRLWFCGFGPDGIASTPNYNVAGINWWSGWLTDNTCGFQADSNVRFVEAGVLDQWSYVNW